MSDFDYGHHHDRMEGLRPIPHTLHILRESSKPAPQAEPENSEPVVE
jgi:hypothetical protein